VVSKEQEYLKVFQKVTRLVSMAQAPQQVMDLVVRRLPELLAIDAASIRLLDSGTNLFVLGAAFGLSPEYLSRDVIDTEQSMQMIRSGHPVAKTVPDNAQEDQHSYSAAQEGIKSVLALPIIFQGHIIGIMRLLTKSHRAFTPKEISFSMALAEQVGMAISNARLFSEMENQVDFLKEVREFSRLVNSTLNLSAILKTIVDKLPKVMGMKACTIRLLQPENDQLELMATSGLSKEYLKRGNIKKENSIFMALKGEPVAIYDAANDSRVVYHDAIRKEGIKSILAVPIKKGTKVIGVLRLLTTEHHCFSSNEVNFAVTVAEVGGNAIQNARTYQKINLLFGQLEENERFLQNILDSLWAQLIVIDKEKRVVMANKRFLEERNLIEKEVLGRPYRSISPWCVGQEDQCPTDQAFSSGKRISTVDSLTEDGREKWLERSLSPMFNTKNETEFVIEAIRDITDRYQLEQEKMKRTKLEGVVQMAGTVAHELNSPLFAALGAAQLLRDELESKEMLEDMDMIIRNIKTMSELIKKMNSMTGFKTKNYVGDTKIIEII
jgi:two-component system, NtrC family, sensor kinase